MNKTDLNLIETFQFYYTPILVVIGIIGNCLTILVFCKTKLRKLSSSYYLVALAFSDTIFLITLSIVWLKLLTVDIFNKHGFCQIMVYLSSVCSFLSVWLVMAFTFERFVAVKYPFLRQSICTTERAKCTIIVLVFIALILFSPLIIFSTIINVDGNNICAIDFQWSQTANIFNYIDFLITYIIPVAMIIYLNFSISRTILSFANVRKILTQENSRFRLKGQRRKLKSFRNKFSQSKLTKMLLVVSTVFLCLSFPSYIMRLLSYLIELNLLQIEDMEMFQLIQHWSQALFYTNFGINFYLYCITGQNFRKTLLDLIYLRRSKRNETTPLTESRTLSTGSSRRKKTLSVYVECQESKLNRKQQSNF